MSDSSDNRAKPVSTARSTASRTKVGGKPASTGRAPRRRRRNPTVILFWLALGLLIGLAVLPTTILFLVGMAPTLVALAIDRDREKYAAITVGSLNFCGVMPSALSLWFGLHTVDHALTLLSNPFNWLIMYFAAGLGWVLYHAVPPVVAIFLTMRSEREMEGLKERQQSLIAEWGEAVTGGERPDE